MSKDEALSIMGDPKSTSASDSIVILNYSLLESFMGRYHPYYIMLRDGKVSEYGKSDDFRGARCPKAETMSSEKAK